MENIVTTDEIPYSANRLYIKLYCERKAKQDNKTIKKAKKSWSRLSISEKKHFYKTCYERNLLKYANDIRETKAYLKEKLSRKRGNRLDTPQRNEDQEKEVESDAIVSIHESNTIRSETELTVPDDSMEIEFIDDEIQNNTHVEIRSEVQNSPDNNQEANNESLLCESTPLSEKNNTHIEIKSEVPYNPDNNQEAYEESLLCEPTPLSEKNNTHIEIKSEVPYNPDNNQEANDESLLCEPTPLSENNKTRFESILSNTNSNQEGTVEITLNEPEPPKLKLSQDLYDLLKKPGDKDWCDMTAVEKKIYQSAFVRIKREYMKNYLKYLQSLSRQQLFDHYKKTLFSHIH